MTRREAKGVPAATGQGAGVAHPLPPPGMAPGALWALVRRQAALYTGMASGSVPVETAQALLDGVLFCLQAALEEDAAAGQLAPEAWLLAGQRVLAVRHSQGLRLQRRARGLALPLDNPVYREALDETARFFTWYDIRFMAHQIPCMLDYPLALPVDDGLRGVDYINAWLRQRMVEDRFCRAFALDGVKAALLRFDGQYAELPLNLFEPVFHCALGKALLHAGQVDLLGGAGAAPRLKALFAGTGAAGADALLRKAAARLCNRLRIWDSESRNYLVACACTPAPYIPALDAAGLANLFVL